MRAVKGNLGGFVIMLAKTFSTPGRFSSRQRVASRQKRSLTRSMKIRLSCTASTPLAISTSLRAAAPGSAKV
jgi:hypothetical protein